MTVPVVVEGLLGRGLSGIHCRYQQTFFGNSEPGHYINIEGDIFKMWKVKMKRFEDKNLTKANNTYRNLKRIEKAMTNERGGNRGVEAKNTPTRNTGKYNLQQTPNATVKSSLGQAAQEIENSQHTILGPMPTMDNSKAASYLLGFQRKLNRMDAKKGQQYEGIDYRSENCVVQAFKKVSYAKRQQGGRTTSYVSSFPFSGHSHILEDGTEIQPPIDDVLPNQEALIREIEQQATEQRTVDAEIADNPFVFLMNQVKVQSFIEEAETAEATSVRLPTNFSMFNKQTEFPYESIPSVFKISPPEQSDSD